MQEAIEEVNLQIKDSICTLANSDEVRMQAVDSVMEEDFWKAKQMRLIKDRCALVVARESRSETRQFRASVRPCR